MRSSLLVFVVLLATAGCGNARFGTDSPELIGPGESLGEVVARHGAPAAVHVVDSQNVILEYPMRSVSGCLGAMVTERGSSLSYSARRSKDGSSWNVTGGGSCSAETGSSPLGMRPDAPLVRVRTAFGAVVLGAMLSALVVGFSLARRRVCGVKRGMLLALLLILASAGKHRCGTENTSLVAAGSPAGQLPSNHGAVDEIFTLPGDGGAILCWWMHESHGIVVLGGEKLSSVAYFVQNGKVVNGGYQSHGEGTYFGFRPHELERGHRGFDVGDVGWILFLAGLTFTLGSAVGRFARRTPPPAPAPKLQSDP